MPGYPDWQRYPARIGDNLLPASTLSLPTGTKVYGAFAVSSWSTVTVTVSPTAGNATVSVTWWNDQAMTEQVKSDSWYLSSVTALQVTVPVFGPWMSLTVDVTSSTSLAASADVRGTGESAGKIIYPVGGSPVTAYARSVAVGGNVLLPTALIRQGQAMWWFGPGDSTGMLRAELVLLAADGTASTEVASLGTPTGNVMQMVVVPDRAFGVYVYNTDTAAAHTFSTGLVFS